MKNRSTDNQSDIQIDGQCDEHTIKQTITPTDSQTNRKTNRKRHRRTKMGISEGELLTTVISLKKQIDCEGVKNKICSKGTTASNRIKKMIAKQIFLRKIRRFYKQKQFVTTLWFLVGFFIADFKLPFLNSCSWAVVLRTVIL